VVTEATEVVTEEVIGEDTRAAAATLAGIDSILSLKRSQTWTRRKLRYYSPAKSIRLESDNLAS